MTLEITLIIVKSLLIVKIFDLCKTAFSQNLVIQNYKVYLFYEGIVLLG